MAIDEDKDFVVKNGLVVNNNLLIAANSKVSIGGPPVDGNIITVRGNSVTFGDINTSGDFRGDSELYLGGQMVANSSGANNAYLLRGRIEPQFNVNNSIYLGGKLEGQLNTNNATYVYGKTEQQLNVNNANFVYGKSEGQLNAGFVNGFQAGQAPGRLIPSDGNTKVPAWADKYIISTGDPDPNQGAENWLWLKIV